MNFHKYSIFNVPYKLKRGGDYINKNREIDYIRAKIEKKLSIPFKLILVKLNLTQQKFIEQSIYDFINKNLELLYEVDVKDEIKQYNT